MIGFSFAFPFLPIFLSHDLGVQSGRDLDLWTAASASASGLAMAIASPMWGVLGDRFGRKSMLIRSMLGGGITVGLIFLAHSPLQLVILRFAQGATSGTIAAATALVAAETPRHRVGWSLGVLTSSIALGGAIGPIIGGLAGAVFGLRLVFLVGGILLLFATIPVFLVVGESPHRPRDKAQPGVVSMIRQRPGTMRALVVLIGAQGLVSLVGAATQSLLVLKLLEMLSRSGASAATGIAFGFSGVANSVSAVGYTQVTKRVGYVRMAAIAALAMAAAVGTLAIAPSAAVVIGVMAVIGLLNGALLPATASMIGLETPSQAQSTVFGLNASSVAFGFFLGPLIGGGVAAAGGVQLGLIVTAVVALGLAALLAVGAREPTWAGTQVPRSREPG